MNFLSAIREELQRRTGFSPQFVPVEAVRLAVQSRCEANRCESLEKYHELLGGSEAEWNRLVEEVVVGETWFWRDEKPFEYLAEFARNYFLNRQEPIRILSAPCSTGEEPYSIAIALLNAGFGPHRFRIDALDISERALAAAKHRKYRIQSFRGSKLFDCGYFEKLDRGFYRLCEKVAATVRFEKGNLVEEAWSLEPVPYDVLFCRNLMIYLDDEGRRKVLGTLHSLLAQTGILFVGHAEAGVIDSARFRSSGPSNAFAFTKARVRPAEKVVTPAKSPQFVASRGSPSKSLKPVEGWIPHAPQVGPIKPADLAKATNLADAGELESAAEVCERYLAAKPDCVKGMRLMAVIRMAQGKAEQAEELFSRVVYLDPENVESMVHLAHYCEARGDQTGVSRWKRRISRLQGAASK